MSKYEVFSKVRNEIMEAISSDFCEILQTKLVPISKVFGLQGDFSVEGQERDAADSH